MLEKKNVTSAYKLYHYFALCTKSAVHEIPTLLYTLIVLLLFFSMSKKFQNHIYCRVKFIQKQ